MSWMLDGPLWRFPVVLVLGIGAVVVPIAVGARAVAHAVGTPSGTACTYRPTGERVLYLQHVGHGASQAPLVRRADGSTMLVPAADLDVVGH